MLDKRGAPVTKWTDRRAVLLDAEGRPVPTAGEAARERNPDARLHPWLAPADIVALGYPPDRGLSASALSMRKAIHRTRRHGHPRGNGDRHRSRRFHLRVREVVALRRRRR